MMPNREKIDYMIRVLDSCKTLPQLVCANNWVKEVLNKMDFPKDSDRERIMSIFDSLYIKKSEYLKELNCAISTH